MNKFLAFIFSCLLSLQFAQAGEIHRDQTAPKQEPEEESEVSTTEICKRCHDFGSYHILGPSLAGVFGRKAGSTDYKRYSDSLKNADFFWTEENLKLFFRDTKSAIKTLTGDENAMTRMPPLHLSDEEIEEAIAFLKTLK